MARSITRLRAFFVAVVLFGISSQSVAQSDSTTVSATDSVRVGQAQDGEIVLDEILIEAVIEKPNVAILPAREVPDFGEIDFINRSFKDEIKMIPAKKFLFDPDFDKPSVHVRIKQILKKVTNK